MGLLELFEVLREVILEVLDGLLDLGLVLVLGQARLKVDELLQLGLGVGDALEGEAESLDFGLAGDRVADLELLVAEAEDGVGLEILGAGQLGELLVGERGGDDGLGEDELVGAVDAEAAVELAHGFVVALELGLLGGDLVAAGLLFRGRQGVLQEDLQALELLDLLGEDLDVVLEGQAVGDAPPHPDVREIGLRGALGAAAQLHLRGGGLGAGRLGILGMQGDAEGDQEERELVHGCGEGGFNIRNPVLGTTIK